jgi:hypothetical protein
MADHLQVHMVQKSLKGIIKINSAGDAENIKRLLRN